MDDQEIVAVSLNAFKDWGCPYCGYRSGHASISGQGASSWTCGECRKGCIILAEGVTVSPFTFGDEGYRPVLQPHPRVGTPSHGRPDTRPEEGGEFFRIRGIGLEGGLTCYVCGKRGNDSYSCTPNIAAFVQTKEAGERVAAMFNSRVPGGAWVDFREHEPDYVQVKIGACEEHSSCLTVLEAMCSDDRINTFRVLYSRAGSTPASQT